jgi:hypothetical protein
MAYTSSRDTTGQPRVSLVHANPGPRILARGMVRGKHRYAGRAALYLAKGFDPVGFEAEIAGSRFANFVSERTRQS